MKCIKDKCEFYSEHEFCVSYFVCGLLVKGRAFLKDKHTDCIVDEEIGSVETYINGLEKLKHNVEQLQQN